MGNQKKAKERKFEGGSPSHAKFEQKKKAKKAKDEWHSPGDVYRNHGPDHGGKPHPDDHQSTVTGKWYAGGLRSEDFTTAKDRRAKKRNESGQARSDKKRAENQK